VTSTKTKIKGQFWQLQYRHGHQGLNNNVSDVRYFTKYRQFREGVDRVSNLLTSEPSESGLVAYDIECIVVLRC
jgi:hypothetical protein